jgi:hypothetical protein
MATKHLSLETRGIKPDLTGRKFGRLFVVSLAEKNGVKSKWVCACSCGNIVDTPTTQRLLDGRARSCARKGCAHTHGLAGSALYNRWCLMKRRCYKTTSKAYKWYGAKGVKLCDEWHNFENFYNWAIETGFRPDLTIDRIDSSGDYEPSNCQWITGSENSRKRVVKRKTVCKNGHKFTPENTRWYLNKQGYKAMHCLDCRLENTRRYNARKKLNQRNR